MNKKIETKFYNVKVLVVEDFDLNREILVEMLNIMAIEPDVAVDGEEAVEKAKSKNYDLILLDLRMPKKDGYEVSREIRGLPIPQPIILAITASAIPDDRGKCLEAGMNDYVAKPVDIWTLEKVLLKYLPIHK